MGNFGNNFGNNWAYSFGGTVTKNAGGGGVRHPPRPRYRTIQITKHAIPIRCRVIRPKITISIRIRCAIEKTILRELELRKVQVKKKPDIAKLKKIGKALKALKDLKKLEDDN